MYDSTMKTVGKRRERELQQTPSGELLKAGALHGEALQEILGGQAHTGIPKGVYRFRTHEEANRQAEDGIIRYMTELAQARARSR